MTRKRITIGLLLLGMALTFFFVVGSFVSYAEPISATRMQNIYIRRILGFGIAMLVLQAAMLALALTDRRNSQP